MKIVDVQESGEQRSIMLRPEIGRLTMVLGGGLAIAIIGVQLFPFLFSWNLVGLLLFVATVYGATQFVVVQGGYSGKRITVDRGRRELVYEWVQWLRRGSRTIPVHEIPEVCCNRNEDNEAQTWDVWLHLILRQAQDERGERPDVDHVVIDWTANEDDARTLARTIARLSGAKYAEHQH